MFRKNSTSEESNFWISYADLMAGLLFVFILLIGAIVSKSIILKSDLTHKESKLTSISKNLKLNLDEIKKLKRMLVKSKSRESKLNNKIIIVETTLNKNISNIKKVKKRLKDYKNKVIVLSNTITNSKKKIKLKDKRVISLLNTIDEKKTQYDDLLLSFQNQKKKIKSLTGIKLKVIKSLKKALGNKIHIDKKTGSLKLASNILFEVGKAELKDRAKIKLKKAFEEYIGALVRNKEIRSHLDKIIIEGHTDSDGSYLYNLKLSQKRALAVMEYLLTLKFTKKYNIRPLMVASGRAYLDLVKVNGVEDKNASRRIEIKFRLKNEDAMREIERVLDAK